MALGDTKGHPRVSSRAERLPARLNRVELVPPGNQYLGAVGDVRLELRLREQLAPPLFPPS